MRTFRWEKMCLSIKLPRKTFNKTTSVAKNAKKHKQIKIKSNNKKYITLTDTFILEL